MSFDMTSSLEIVQQSRCPVHFVITKWDLLADICSLQQVKDKLLTDENLRDLISAKAQDTRASIRLFPVSAVGFEFATPEPNGAMKKNGTPPRPHNVELPLLSILPDFMKFAHDELAQKRTDLEGPEKSGLTDRLLEPGAIETWQPAVRSAAQLLGPKLRGVLVARFPSIGQLIPDELFVDALGFGAKLLSARTARAQAGRQQYAQSLMHSRDQLHTEGEALELLELQCIDIITGFEEHLPASVLAGGIAADELSLPFVPNSRMVDDSDGPERGSEI
ncbi:hypothetical protein [Arthrobacter sp. SAFR-044]|uniref:hypothetical protein n=1 Tax=Arthrobacter sp. SAFR-044 TaxID=3387278 RepID=UPI003F7C83B5